MPSAHRLVGTLSLAVFVATGLYMRLRFPELYQGSSAMRIMFRSAHAYIALAALLNLTLGMYWREFADRAARRLQRGGSLLLLCVPALFTLAFFLEPAPDRLSRPFTLLGVVLAVVGTLLHVAAARREETGRP